MPKVEEKKKQYNSRDVKSYYHTSLFHNITVQSSNIILHTVYNNILQNLPIFQEDVEMAEGIYGFSVTNFQGKKIVTRFIICNLLW